MDGAVTLIKKFCQYDFVERDLEKTLSLLTEDIRWFGTSDHEDVHSKDEARKYLQEEIQADPKPYETQLLEESFSPIGSDGSIAFLRMRFSHSSVSVIIRITAASRIEDGEEKLCSIHFSVSDAAQKDDEFFPVEQNRIRLEQEQKSLLLSTMDGGLIGCYNEDGFPFYSINDKMLEYLGYSTEDEFVTKIHGLIENVIHPDDRAMVNQATHQQLEKNNCYSVDYRMCKKDGSYIWFHDVGKLATGQNGRKIIVSVCYNVTSEHEKQSQIENMLDALPGGMVLYRFADGDVKLLYQSKGMAEIAGLTNEEYKLWIADSAKVSIHPDDVEKVYASIEEAANKDESVSLDYRVPHKNGGYVWINGCFRRTGTDDGAPVIHAVFTAMPKLRELMNDITEHSGFYVVVTDQKSHELLYLNQAAVEGAYECEVDYAGKKCYEYLLGRDTPCDFCPHINPISNGEPEELYVKDLDKHFIVQGHITTWAGHQARVEYLTDITREHREKQQLDSIINAIPGGVAIYKISDIFQTVYFSDGVPELSGYTVLEYNELIKCDAAQMTHPDDREMVVKNLREACANDTTADFIFRKIHRDGHTVWVHVQGTKIGEQDGCPLIQCVFHNISMQKEQEMLNQHLLNSMSGGVVIYEVINSTTLSIVQYSKGIAALTGHTETEYVSLYENGFDIICEQERPDIYSELDKVLKTDQSIQASYHICHKDGHPVGVHMNARVIGNRNGHPLICCVIMKMSEETNLYQHIAQKSSNGIYVIAKETRKMLYMNTQAKSLFNISQSTDISATPCYKLLRQSNNGCEDCKVFDTLHEGQPYELYIPHLNKHMQGIPYSMDWSGIPAYVVYVSDITASKTAMQEITNIYNNIPGAVFRCRFDSDWTVISANNGLFRFLGYTREEFAAMGNKMSAVIYPEDLTIMTGVISSQLQEGKTTAENENRLICKDGTIKWISIKAQLLMDDQGQRYFYCVFVDISKQKENELRRIASEKNLKVAVDHMSVYYWEIIDFNQGLIRSSQRIQESFGIDEICTDFPEFFISKGFVSPEDCDTYRKGVERIYQGQPYSQFDVRIKTLTHGYAWMRLRLTRIEESGAKPRAVCTAEEIAEYKDLEQRVSTVMKQNNISSWRYDLRRYVLMPNMQGYWSEAWNIKAGEYAPGDLKNLLHPDDIQPWLEFHSKLSKSTGNDSICIRVKGGSDYRHLLCHYTLMTDRDGVPTYALGSCTDITEQIHQQEKYENAIKHRYRALDKNVMLIGHCNITRDKLIELEDRTEMELQKRFGNDRNDFFTGLGTLIPVESERKSFYSATLSAPLIADFALGITHHSAIFLAEINSGGHDLCWLSLSIDTVEHPETRDLLGFMSITDITENKMQEQMLETVVQRNYDYIAHVSLIEDSMTLYRHREMSKENPSYQTGQTYCLSDAMKYSAHHFVISEEQEMYLEKSSPKNLMKKLQDNNSYEFAFHLMENGMIRAKRMRIDILDRTTGTAVMTRSDVTEVLSQQEQQKNQLYQALEIAKSANKHKTEFLSAMSHDIRTPMNAIIGMCALALENEQDTQQIHESLQTIRSSSQILLSLINNILDMSRIESGKMVLNDAPFSLLTQVKKTADSYRVLAEQKNQHFNLYTNIHHDGCKGDVSRVHSAIDNVLSNAIKYTPENGSITYRVSELPSTNPDIGLFRFEISDTGIGISEKDVQHIFDPFYRGTSDESQTIQGTGLGLSITKQIVELKGGTLSVKSSPKVGTTFVIDLPLHFCNETSIQATDETDSQKTKYDFTGVNILLCEDHPINQKVITRILEKVNAKVTIAKNGQEGLQLFSKSKPETYNMILMDIRMPIMDGYEAASAMRACNHPEAKSIPIVALSANAFTEDVQKSIMHGMNSHIAKPVTPDQIYKTVQSYCTDASEISAYKKKVLFVDDSEINIAVLTANLQDNYDVFIARNGTEALNTLEQNPDIAAVITDILMPEMDGVTLIKTIRANTYYDHIAVLANTQYGGSQQEQALKEIGADDFIYKPTTPEMIEKRLNDALKKHSK